MAFDLLCDRCLGCWCFCGFYGLMAAGFFLILFWCLWLLRFGFGVLNASSGYLGCLIWSGLPVEVFAVGTLFCLVFMVSGEFASYCVLIVTICFFVVACFGFIGCV